MINFDVEPEFQEQIDWVEKFAKEEIEPLDNFFVSEKPKTAIQSPRKAGPQFENTLKV